MACATSSIISVKYISIPDALSAFMQSLVGLSNNPASLYLSVSSQSLVVYVATASTINVFNLSRLRSALDQNDNSAVALKSFLETGTTIKVFFDARMPAKILFDVCAIKLANKICTERAFIHEIQLMELALRRSDNNREWLAGFDKCIENDSDLDVDAAMLGNGSSGIGIDERILHLPVLWKKYHGQLISGRFGVGGSFWIMMIREATQKRLEVSHGEEHRGYLVNGARSGWYRESIEEVSESWNDDLMMDISTDGEFLGGAEHWAQFNVL
ncbi:hypothetical protein DM02DRAFT_733234 [Periconia macrospinosa]|uniref:Uncharacterized protein n=1 Tax=Periconia macrospinosa TaxID=97972 RepID=A0A2V1D7V8_9PLEO|nr:hypothetical protein DM02DRAFT_733234 [Periconia macrospinosa]